MTSQELKNSILQFAVQGKLVPQNPQDEPASELLEKIKAENNKLILGKKNKSNKLSLPITDEEKPYELPESWEWVRLGELCEIINGFTPLRSKSEFWINGTIPWFTVADIHLQGRIITKTSQSITEKALRNDSKRILPINTILLCCTASIGEYAINKIPLTTNQQFNGFVIKEEYKSILSPNYLFTIAPTFKRILLELAGKTTFNFVSVKKTESILIPLPPLAEQQRIVDKIDELLPLVEQYGAAESELRKLNTKFPEQLKKSVLQYAVQGKLVPQNLNDEPASFLFDRIKAEKKQLIKGKQIKQDKPLPEIKEDEIPFEIPDSWVWVRLNDLTSKIGSGSTPTGGKAVYLSDGIKFIRSQNVYNDGLRLNNIAYISEKTNKAKKGSIVLPDDILLNITGASIGRCAIVPSDFDKANINQHVMIIRLIDKSIIEYLHFCLTSTYIQSKIMDVQVGVSREGLSATKLMEFLIPLPPLSEQKLIVEKVEEVLKYCDKLK